VVKQARSFAKSDFVPIILHTPQLALVITYYDI